MRMRFPAFALVAGLVFSTSGASLASEVTGSHAVKIVPLRVWRALEHQLADEGGMAARKDPRRFEATVRVAGSDEWIVVGVDWDESSGGARIDWRAPASATDAAARWAERVARRAHDEPQDNPLCRGNVAPGTVLSDPSMEGTPTCHNGTGRFSSALFELEKCGDPESALRILAACVREKHAGGLIRLAQFFEDGSGVPQRPERMTEYLRRGAHAETPGYRGMAQVQYATALYFGIGTPADRTGALHLFREAAAAGNADARHFLAHGYHYAWRKQDGSVYADPAWKAVR